MRRTVLDLSYLWARSAVDLAADLGDAEVLITSELIYELATASKKKLARVGGLAGLLDKLAGLALAGSHALLRLLNIERGHEEPTKDVVDNVATEDLNRFVGEGAGFEVIEQVDEAIRRFFEEDEPRKLRNGLERMWEPRHDEAFKEARGAVGQGTSVEQVYVDIFGRLPEEDVGREIANTLGMKTPPTSEWMLFRYERLRNFIAFRYRLAGTQPDQLADKTIANDLLDAHYVCFLQHADGIATADKKLVEPAARAFFEGKQIISRP